MKNKDVVATACYVAAFVTAVVGMYWNHLVAPLADERPGTWLMFIVGIVASALSKSIAKESPLRIVVIVGMATAAGVFVDAILHFFIPPDTGNLWPLSVVAVGVMGSIAGVIGIIIGGASMWVRKQIQPSNGT